jgi:hypothetical protein
VYAIPAIFDGGRRRAANDQAVAARDASVDAYKLTVLTAFQGVEDNLAAQRILEVEAAQQARAVEAVERLLTLARNRYRVGVATYLEVVTAQSAALSNQRTGVGHDDRHVKTLADDIREADRANPAKAKPTRVRPVPPIRSAHSELLT